MLKRTEPTNSIGQIVTENPQRSKIFEKLEIDYCCGGKRTLSDVCQEKGLDVSIALEDLTKVDNE